MDATAFHILIQLVKRGDLDQSDIDEIAARLEAEGESDAAHAVRTVPIEATIPSEAEQKRSTMRIVHRRPDGGN